MSKAIEPAGLVIRTPRRCQVCGHPHQRIGHKVRFFHYLDGFDAVCADCWNYIEYDLLKASGARTARAQNA